MRTKKKKDMSDSIPNGTNIEPKGQLPLPKVRGLSKGG